MNTQEDIKEMLQNYRSYKFGVLQFERHKPMASAGIANYDPMPGPRGASLLFFDQQAKMADMGHTSLADLISYQKDKEAVEVVEGALYTLTEDERSVIILKWMDGITLKQIEQRKPMCLSTIKMHHRRGWAKMYNSLRFVEIPEIHNLDKVCSF
jgi:hypothetical protein